LPRNWRQTPPPSALAQIGDEFVRGERAAALTVPSVLSPVESNWLINPRHPAFAKIRLHPAEDFQYDSRFYE
jgi:RES domain-containing protein